MLYHHKNGLTLRKLAHSDLDWLYAMKVPSWTSMHSTPIIHRADQDLWYDSFNCDEYHLVCERLIEDSVGGNGEGKTVHRVGYVSLTNIQSISRTAWVLMMVDPEYRGTQWSPKVPESVTDFGFEILNLHRLQAEVLDNNPAAMKFDLELGYKVEGRFRKAIYKCGNYHDSILIGMLRDEWVNSDRIKAYGGICNTQYKQRGPIDRVISRISKSCQSDEGDPKYQLDGNRQS
jgi:RimJ/RimL family protein N-acetyltransferase